jgi:AraC-like DNA-binding protein
MSETLLTAVRRYADSCADSQGVATTPMSGLNALRAHRPSELLYAISRPLVALVVQGSKRVMMGNETFDLGAGDSLFIAADVPTASQITRASVGAPYYALVVDLNLAVIEELAVEMGAAWVGNGPPVRVDRTDAEVIDAALRLTQLLDRPAAVPILGAQLMREMHYWLLTGKHGLAIRDLCISEGNSRRVARAVAIIRSDYAKPLRSTHLAEVAGMSPSTFHMHFRAVTSLSPLQFQKQLRLIEARRMMLSEGVSASNAAYAVGYESVPQFTREYGRLFGASPVRDIKAAKTRVYAAA